MYIRTLLVLAFTTVCFAQDIWSVGGFIGYGWYKNASVFAPTGKAEAGIHNRFVAGMTLCEDSFEHISGEFRYVYHDGDPFLSAGSIKENIQGASHTFLYEVLVHVRDREQKIRPYAVVGAGAKLFHVSGPPLQVQPLSNIATLTTRDDFRWLVSVGGGVKMMAAPHVIVRFDFRDFINPFPDTLIKPVAFATGRGLFQQFTPMVGVDYSW